MKRITYARLAVFMLAVAGLALQGCGGDDNGGLSAADMARIEAAEMAAAAAQAEAEAAHMEAEEAKADAAAAEEAAEQARQDAMDAMEEEDAYSPDDPGGTLEGQEGRAAAQRIADSAGAMIMGGAGIGSLSQARLGDDPMLTIAVTGGSGLSTADDMADMDAPMIDGFTGVALEKDGPGAVTQHSLVYSDAERSVRAWGDVYRYNTDADGAELGTTLPTEAARTHLRIGTAPSTGTLEDFDSNASWDHGLSTTTGVLTRTFEDGDSVTGSYDGVSGQYTFNGTTTITWDGTDVTFTAGAGAVVFKADDPDMVIPDRDYLAFGIWSEVPDSPTTANPGRVRPFMMGNATAYSIMNVHGLSGSASYSGGAVGHYATRAKGSHMVYEGRFTASASLTANFDAADASVTAGAGTDPDALGFRETVANATGTVLSGTIDDFMSEDGTEMPGWLVNLNMGVMMPGINDNNTPADLTDDTAILTSMDIMGTTTGTTGSQAFTGVWDAQMYGNNTADYPTGVAGRFQAEMGTAQPMSTPEGRINLFADEGFAGVVGSFAGRED